MEQASVIYDDDGHTGFQLTENHPGGTDPHYRRQRAHIARLALAHRSGMPIPEIEYTSQEHRTWAFIAGQLARRHRERACSIFLEGAGELNMPDDHVPQMADVSARLKTATGFTLTPSVGTVPPYEFYSVFHDSSFKATQFIRHHSSPRFSPEPDMVHELIGHANAIANDRLADLYRRVGNAIVRLESEDAIDLVTKVFWFCFETGVVREGRSSIKVLGASILSSAGEMDNFERAEMLPLDLGLIARQRYTDKNFQPTLFCADSINHLEDFVSDFCASIDDETPHRIRRGDLDSTDSSER